MVSNRTIWWQFQADLIPFFSYGQSATNIDKIWQHFAFYDTKKNLAWRVPDSSLAILYVGFKGDSLDRCKTQCVLRIWQKVYTRFREVCRKYVLNVKDMDIEIRP